MSGLSRQIAVLCVSGVVTLNLTAGYLHQLSAVTTHSSPALKKTAISSVVK